MVAGMIEAIHYKRVIYQCYNFILPLHYLLLVTWHKETAIHLMVSINSMCFSMSFVSVALHTKHNVYNM